MRWKSEEPPHAGDKRIRSFFALLPVDIDHDVRWFEWVAVEEKFYQGYDGSGFWVLTRFVDKVKK